MNLGFNLFKEDEMAKDGPERGSQRVLVTLFSESGTAEKYYRLGFSDDGLSLKLTIGCVSINAVEYPGKNVALFFSSIGPRIVCQYDIFLPESCSIEQIAGLIYVNIADNFRSSTEMFKAHFQKLGLALFQ
jgi:hypothetical protein